MKNQVLRKILPLFLLVAITLLMCTHAQAGAAFASTSNFNSPVKASECCDFLNQTAVSDPNHLYDQHIATDPDAACIVRLGRSGKYFYQVIAGRENFPVTYVDFPDEEKYCGQTGDALFNDDGNSDQSLKSSQSGFQVDASSTLTLALAVAALTSLQLVTSTLISKS